MTKYGFKIQLSGGLGMRPRWLCVVCCVVELCGTLSLCTMACVHLAFVLLHEDMYLLQDGWTALMVASVTGMCGVAIG